MQLMALKWPFWPLNLHIEPLNLTKKQCFGGYPANFKKQSFGINY